MTTITVFKGDGIGPEIIAAAEQVLQRVNSKFGLDLTWEQGLLGGAAIDAHGEPYPAVTSEQAKKADANALYQLANYYLIGFWFPQDKKMVEKYLIQAANQGSAQAAAANPESRHS